MANNTIYARKVDVTLAQARRIAQGALEEARRRQLMPMTVVVLDAGGDLIICEREDGSGTLRFEVARGKAYGALGLGLGSRTVGARNQGRDAFLAALAVASDGRCVPVPGGVLILDDTDTAIGAVGVSGDASDADEACAVAGIEAAGFTAGIDPAGE